MSSTALVESPKLFDKEMIALGLTNQMGENNP